MHLIGFLAFFLGTVQAAVGPADIIATLEGFAGDAISLQKSAAQVNLVTAHLVTFKQGPLWACVNGLNAAADEGAQVAAVLPGTASYGPNDDASKTYKAYADFATAHVELFNILSNRAGQFFLPAPLIAKPVVASLLRAQAVIDGVSSFLINTVNPSPANFQSQLTPLDVALNTCIAKWKKTCGSFC